MLFAAPPAVEASTTIGHTNSNPIPCLGRDFVMQTNVGSAPGYVVPPGGGVITSWSLDDTNSGTTGAARLKVLRPATSPTFTVVGQSALSTIVANKFDTLPTRVPVAGGDLLGLWVSDSPSSEVSCLFQTSDTADLLTQLGIADPQPGTVVDTSSSANTQTRLNVSAKVEPDVAGDGFGDETQDACPNDPAIQTAPCQADLALTASAAPVGIGLGDVTLLETTFSGGGPGTSLATFETVDLSPGLQLVASDLSCNFSARTFRCPLGPVAPGTRRTDLFVLKGTSLGAQTAVVAGGQADPDPRTANNSARAGIIVARRSGASCRVPRLRGLTVAVARRLLRAANCKLGKVAHKHVGGAPAGTVVSQRPRKGSRAAGSPVRVTVER